MVELRDMDESRLLQVREAAEELGIHENTLRRWERDGYIAAVKLPSGVRRFPVGEVRRVRATMNREVVARKAIALTGTEGARAVHTLAELAHARVSLSSLDAGRFGIEPDGSLRLSINDESFELLSGLVGSSSRL